MKPRRSALYMPGANARALEKAKSLAADLLILDLEDAVAPEAKAAARVNIAEAFAGEGYGRKQVALRTNGHATTWFADDLALAADVGVSAVLVPKVGSGPDVAAIRAQMSAARIAPTVELMAMIETPAGVLNVSEIAALAPGDAYPLTCFVIGTNDLVKETRATLDAARTAALYWLSATVTAARAHGIDVLDGVYNAFKDLEGYRAECEQGRMLGMDGKTLIHPSQIEIANEVFSPTAEAVAEARRILAAFALPENQGKGVISIDGRMIELLHADMARRTVAFADAIGLV
ncbi:MAG: HpcH/HpaI aldolase/citrate lyase family protein [Hyphomicrobiaceae bacterium]